MEKVEKVEKAEKVEKVEKAAARKSSGFNGTVEAEHGVCARVECLRVEALSEKNSASASFQSKCWSVRPAGTHCLGEIPDHVTFFTLHIFVQRQRQSPR